MADPSTKPLTIREAAAALGLSNHTLRAWIAQRRLTYVRLGRSIRVLPSAIEDKLRRGTVEARPQSNNDKTEARKKN